MSHQICQTTGGLELSMSSAHDDLLTFLLGGGPGQNSISTHMVVISSSEVVTWMANTRLSKGQGRALCDMTDRWSEGVLSSTWTTYLLSIFLRQLISRGRETDFLIFFSASYETHVSYFYWADELGTCRASTEKIIR